MIQDPSISTIKDMIKITEGFDAVEPFLLDGPVSKKVAVIDFSPENGKRLPGAHFLQFTKHKLGQYVDSAGKNLYNASGSDLYTPEFMEISVFATVLKTVYMIEDQKTLGRSLSWAFNSPQLLVVPRAGEWANAFYDRSTHSLQFFYFTPKGGQKPIYTCLSRDIVAHETGHAIVDGIAPDLNNACSPHALALHEALADITALLMAFQSHPLVEYVLKSTNGSIDNTKPFSAIAEEFGDALKKNGRGLRNLHNAKNLDPSDETNGVVDDEPHALSEVLSGALYGVFEKIFDDLKPQIAQKQRYQKFSDPMYSASGETVAVAARRLKRMVFRGLDICPPGEISFAEYGRAMIAADKIAYPGDDKMRTWLCKEFLNRHIILDEEELALKTDFSEKLTECMDSKKICTSDWLAYDFVNKHRELFCLPESVPFEVRPRLMVTKKYDNDKKGKEFIFKVAWDHEESLEVEAMEAKKRKIMVGTTLVFDGPACKILARLTSAPPEESNLACQGLVGKQRDLAIAEYTAQRSSRDHLLSRLNEEGLLKFGSQAFVNSSKTSLSSVEVQVKDGVISTRSMANLLHIAGQEAGD